MINKYRSFNFNVNFSDGTFKSDEDIIMIENDNKSIKFIFNFEEEEINEQTVLVKMKNYNGDVKETTLYVENNLAELIVTNDILEAGNLRMSISLTGTDNEILTTTEYVENIVIKEDLGSGEELSEEDSSSLTNAISQVNTLIEELKSIEFSLNEETGNLEVAYE